MAAAEARVCPAASFSLVDFDLFKNDEADLTSLGTERKLRDGLDLSVVFGGREGAAAAAASRLTAYDRSASSGLMIIESRAAIGICDDIIAGSDEEVGAAAATSDE